MELLEDQGCNYIFGLPGNARLSKTGQPWCEDVAVRRVQRGKDKLRRFFRVGYRAKSWSRERTVVARVEATSKGCDVRFRQFYWLMVYNDRGELMAANRLAVGLREQKKLGRGINS